MLVQARTVTLLSALLLPLASLRAEAPADPSGHWAGAIEVPSGALQVEVDLAMVAGQLTGTFSNPGEKLKGYPLSSATVDGRVVLLEIKTGGSGPQTFAGTLSADGQTLSGNFLISPYGMPFALKRTGSAKIDAPPRSAAIDEKFVGAWTSSLDIDGTSLPVTLTLTNHADGAATGSWAIGDGSATPIKIALQGQALTLESAVAPAVYSGTLSADGATIAGTLKEPSFEKPVLFTRVAAR